MIVPACPSADILEPQKRFPSVSVIVVTKGNRRGVEAAVQSILATDYPPGQREVVVIEETAAPRPIAAPGVRYFAIAPLNRGVGAARNEGLRRATGEIIAFTDDDCIVERDWLKELVRPLADNPEAGATAGAVGVPPCGPIGRCENILGFPGGGLAFVRAARGNIIPMRTFSTCNCAIRRAALGEDLHFHEGFQYAGEDQLLSRAISARHPVLFTPRARVLHAPRDSFAGVFKWLVRRGRAQVETIRHSRDKREHIAYIFHTSVFLRLAASIALLALMRIPILPGLAVLLILYYLCLLWRFRWVLDFGIQPGTWALVPVVKAVMDAGMSIGVIKALLTRRRLKQ